MFFNTKINILIPAAGKGERLSSYKLPKPLITIKGYPMINWATRNVINCNSINHFIYLIRKDLSKINSTLLQRYLLELRKNNIIIEVEDNQDGPVITCLKASCYYNNDIPLIITNCDMFLGDEKFNINDFIFKMKDIDGGIVVFEPSDLSCKYSYVSLNDNKFVDKVAEKEPISNYATVGIYYWKKGSDFVKYANKMIEKNIRINNEFYVCPVYQEAIDDNKKIKIYKINEFYDLGDPESLEKFSKSK